MLNKITGKKPVNIVKPLVKENNSYSFNDKKYQTFLKKNYFWPKIGNFGNSRKEEIERKVDKFLARKPKNSMEHVTLKENQRAIKPLNNYSAPGSDRIGTLRIKNGGDYLQKSISDIVNTTLLVRVLSRHVKT